MSIRLRGRSTQLDDGLCYLPHVSYLDMGLRTAIFIASDRNRRGDMEP